MMDDEIPRFLCDGVLYDMMFLSHVQYTSTAVLRQGDFFGVILAYNVFSRPSLEEMRHLYDASHMATDRAELLRILVLGIRTLPCPYD